MAGHELEQRFIKSPYTKSEIMTFEEKYPDTELRALSWKQPFGSLMLHGKIETRIWDSKYRGWVLICASKAPYNDNDILKIAGNEQYGRIHTICPKEPTGKAIAIGRLIESRFMTKQDENKCFVQHCEPWLHTSKKTSKKSWKRLWCHIYEDVQAIESLDWYGSQGWSIVNESVKHLIIIQS